MTICTANSSTLEENELYTWMNTICPEDVYMYGFLDKNSFINKFNLVYDFCKLSEVEEYMIRYGFAQFVADDYGTDLYLVTPKDATLEQLQDFALTHPNEELVPITYINSQLFLQWLSNERRK